MDRKVKKKNVFTIFMFVLGIVVYLVGLLLLFSSSISRTSISKVLFANINFTSELVTKMKLTGAILFISGFIIFMLSVISLYKHDNILENNVNLIVEGKADVITLIIMTYVMIFMVVICLLYNEMIGALLFGVTIVIQNIVNSLLIKYYSKSYKRK